MPRPRKRLGQHFLSDARILARVVDALDPRSDETIVEIGPGPGTLTALLEGRARQLVLVELDRVLAARLRERYADNARVRVVEGDVLDTPLAPLAGESTWSVVGNIPYYITTPILFHALTAPRPRAAVFLVQSEVADRLAAVPGSDAYGALSVNAQAVATIVRHGRVPRGAFHPPPSVDSTIVRLDPREQPLVAPAEEAGFRVLVQGAFSMRRKQMLRVLRSLWDLTPERATALLQGAGIAATDRPEVLAPGDYVRLLRAAAADGLELEAAWSSRPRRRSDSTGQS